MKRPIEAIIEDVIVEPSKIQPIIVNFQNGELKDEEAKKMSCGLFRDQKKNKTLLGLSNGQVVYKGYRPDTSKELTQTMLVLHNRRTGTVRLVQAERWNVSAVLGKSMVDDRNTTAEEKNALLNKQFGSKRIKRRTEQYEKLQVNVESIKEELEKTVSNVEIDRMDLSMQLPDNEFLTNTSLPKCNREAMNVNDVYNVYDIIPKHKLELLYETALEVINDCDNHIEGKPQFYIHALKHLASKPDNVEKVAILLYIETIVKWLNMPIKDARKRHIEVCPESQEISSYITDTYSVQSSHGRLRPNSMKDKGVIHCMILALMISNFELNTETFVSMFSHRIGLKKLTDLARIIGALPNKEDKKIICLRVPLPAQVAIVRKAKKK